MKDYGLSAVLFPKSQALITGTFSASLSLQSLLILNSKGDPRGYRTQSVHVCQ